MKKNFLSFIVPSHLLTHKASRMQHRETFMLCGWICTSLNFFSPTCAHHNEAYEKKIRLLFFLQFQFLSITKTTNSTFGICTIARRTLRWRECVCRCLFFISDDFFFSVNTFFIFFSAMHSHDDDGKK